ncbi:metal ABC transporter substrate-binding protein [Oceanobacillus sp. HCA-5259]|uniref:metal ABC transporter substrate-binding protein n=1 Tax=Oceanobacillus sp. HCA-5259 TaxID=3134661 RepID=UPI0030C5348E
MKRDQDNRVDESSEDITIYTTVYPLQYIVEEIGGDTVTVHSVFPPGVDGHMYEPTSKEMTDFAASDAFIYIGAGMEGFANSVSEALGLEDIALIEIGKHEELFQKGTQEGSDHEHEDEHAIEIQGLSDHYHTGDIIELTANLHIDSEHDHWH